ncbi:UBN2_3 domain-containing protein [Cephalotus follicularis]|uniref:UBN2_3 domain-containing protein n=1 Tax=Cephalotus follicularis TaxID=3775 RepID=A0A1Q3D490_CEPFO|nr:UBN2_3 domain-containing protein [Cephalotus follicularis]
MASELIAWHLHSILIANSSSPTDITSLANSHNIATNTTFSSSLIVILNISDLIPIKLGSSNYLLWKSFFEPVLHRHNLIQFLNGSTSPPAPNDLAYKSWYEKDQMLL